MTEEQHQNLSRRFMRWSRRRAKLIEVPNSSGLYTYDRQGGAKLKAGAGRTGTCR
jgi:hypothetical protein